MIKYICEFLGTMILIILGNGAVASATLEKSKMKNGGPIFITIAWGLAVMIPAFIFGSTSNAVFNPALAIALAITGTLSIFDMLIYIIAELLGAIVGQFIVYFLYKDHFNETTDSNTISGCFYTAPAIPNKFRNLIQELISTFILVFALLGIKQANATNGLNYILVFGIITSIGMSLGGLTGYALNPARDLGPRIVHQIVPLKYKGKSNWSYSFVPIIGPILGAIIASFLYLLLF